MAELPCRLLEILNSYGSPVLDGIGEALLTAPEVSVRANPLKGFVPVAGEGRAAVPWCADAVYLPCREQFAFDPLWHQGAYYVQDASSMFVARVVSHVTGAEPVRMLDACAAPGGKTTAAMSVLPSGSSVVANEYVPARASVLRENLAKWGFPLWRVTVGPTDKFASGAERFDVILADVPCSGEGMMRKDAEAVAQWTPALVDQCAARQREIVANLWPALAPGGYMIYSTCTFNRSENEEMVEWIAREFGAEGVEIPVESSWGICSGINTHMPCLRFIPGKVRGEGLFMAVLRKPSDDSAGRRQPHGRDRNKGKKRTGNQKDKEIAEAELTGWLEGEWHFENRDGEIWAVASDSAFAPELHVGTLKGRSVVPSATLAMSTLLRPDAFPRVEVDAATAVSYLGCNAVTLPDGAPKGTVLLTFGSRPLGFVKNLGSRANNLYPKAWRILAPSPEPVVNGFIKSR